MILDAPAFERLVEVLLDLFDGERFGASGEDEVFELVGDDLVGAAHVRIVSRIAWSAWSWV